MLHLRQFPLLHARRAIEPIRSIRLTLSPVPGPGHFRRLMGAMMRIRMLVAAVAATVGLLAAAVAAQAQTARHVRPVTAATLHRG